MLNSITSTNCPPTSQMVSWDFIDDLSAEALLEWTQCRFANDMVVTTSFGIQSAVTLHLASRVWPDIPVLWVDTGYLPKETYDYAETLTKRLELNLHVYQSEISPARMEAQYGELWASERVEDLDKYDRIRKVEPLAKAFEDLNPEAWISGLRREQTKHRSSLERVRHDGDRYRILPILEWSQRQVYEYMSIHRLPQHPLWEHGYVTIGDWHSSRPLFDTDHHERATRFGGLKEECGIHM